MRYQCSYNVTERLTWEIYLDEYSFWYHINFLKTSIMQVRPLSTGLVLRSQLEPRYAVRHCNYSKKNVRIGTLQHNQLRKSIISLRQKNKQHLAYNPDV